VVGWGGGGGGAEREIVCVCVCTARGGKGRKRERLCVFVCVQRVVARVEGHLFEGKDQVRLPLAPTHIRVFQAACHPEQPVTAQPVCQEGGV